jgi:hypothetical protein
LKAYFQIVLHDFIYQAWSQEQEKEQNQTIAMPPLLKPLKYPVPLTALGSLSLVPS